MEVFGCSGGLSVSAGSYRVEETKWRIAAVLGEVLDLVFEKDRESGSSDCVWV